jgi:hypothetical protein
MCEMLCMLLVLIFPGNYSPVLTPAENFLRRS